jgi:threonine aldolase
MFDELSFPTSLGSDNHSGIHPKVLEALLAANRGHAHAYGMDELCRLTEKEFTRLFGLGVQPEYVFTGTAANVLSFVGSLRSYEAVVCGDVSHLNMDECGAPEKYLGSKLWPVKTEDGRIFPEQLDELLQRMGDQHFSQPRAVSLTQPTELGVCYSLEELRKWRKFTRDKNLMLHLDGARLANAAVTLGCSLMELTADLGIDAVSFGGTKNGLLGAEAVLLFSDEAKRGFKFFRKQAMQLSSKTRFLAAQYHAYLKDDLWREIATHVTGQARSLAARLEEFPEIRLAYPVQSNGLFVRLPKAWIAPLRERFFFYVWDPEIQLCRWMISWDWNDSTSDRLLAAIREVKKCFPAK